MPLELVNKIFCELPEVLTPSARTPRLLQLILILSLVSSVEFMVRVKAFAYALFVTKKANEKLINTSESIMLNVLITLKSIVMLELHLYK